MEGPWKHIQWQKPGTKGHIVWFHFYEMSKIDKSTEIERLVVAKGLGRRKWGIIANGYGVSFWDDKNILELNRDDSCITCEYTKIHWVVYLNA